MPLFRGCGTLFSNLWYNFVSLWYTFFACTTTHKGGVNEEVGVVHAGEWVASQRLLANPQARAMIETLDYAQRTNTIGSLSATDVSRSITAPLGGATPQVVVQTVPDNTQLLESLALLNQRLNEPFVTINTITGDTGIKKAQDEYNKLIKNKTPKSKR